MYTPKTKIKNHSESYLKHSKPFKGHTNLFLLEYVHWDTNTTGSLNSFISDESRRVCDQFSLRLQTKQILPEPTDNWKGSGTWARRMRSVTSVQATCSSSFGRPLIWKVEYESYPLNPLKPEWLVIVFLPTAFTPCSNLTSDKGEEIPSLQSSGKKSATCRSFGSYGSSSLSC